MFFVVSSWMINMIIKQDLITENVLLFQQQQQNSEQFKSNI